MALLDKIKSKLQNIDKENLQKQAAELAENAKKIAAEKAGALKDQLSRTDLHTLKNQVSEAAEKAGKAAKENLDKITPEDLKKNIQEKIAHASDSEAAAKISQITSNLAKKSRKTKAVIGTCLVIGLLLAVIFVFGESWEQNAPVNKGSQSSAGKQLAPDAAKKILTASLPGKKLSPADYAMLERCLPYVPNFRNNTCLLNKCLAKMSENEVNGFYLECMTGFDPAFKQAHSQRLREQGVPSDMIAAYWQDLEGAATRSVIHDAIFTMLAARECSR